MRWAFNPAVMRHLLNFWPPFLFNGIRVVELSTDYRYAKVTLNDRPWRRNINSSQFGGAMFRHDRSYLSIDGDGGFGKRIFGLG